MLTERQLALVSAIIKEYTKTAEPVGSVEITVNHNFHCSPATIRNEMAKLIDMGFLEMLHTSSGRVPTKLAYKLYLEEIFEEDEIPVLQEVAVKQRLWPARYEMNKMLKEATKALSDMTKTMSLATTTDGYITSSGVVNILDHPEFWDLETAKTAYTLLDHYELLEGIFDRAPLGSDVRFIIGDELGIKNMERCAMVFTTYEVGNKKGHVAVIGPARMEYGKVIPAIKYTKNLIEELGEAW
jgi:transcriptional regulator of heat shock response